MVASKIRKQPLTEGELEAEAEACRFRVDMTLEEQAAFVRARSLARGEKPICDPMRALFVQRYRTN